MRKNYLIICFLFPFVIVLVLGFFILAKDILADNNAAVTITVKISVCGNGEKEYGEDCDKTDLGGATCSSRGFLSGNLACDSACGYDTTGCTSAPSCGDGSCNGSETCSSCSADCGSCGGGGGGGGGYLAPVTSAIFSGRAYPKTVVTLLKDAQVAATTIASTDANFRISLSGLSGGNYIFAVYGEDSKGIRSSLLTFPVSVTSGVTTSVGGIFIAPTIAVDKSEVKRGDDIAIFGQSAPQADIVISVASDEEFFDKTVSDKAGAYLYNFDTSFIDHGTHYTKSKASISNMEMSGFSNVISFKVGTKNVAKATQKFLKGDLNGDGKVNLVDFSIAAYWYKRPISAEFAIKEFERLSGDGKVDLVDFSIMAYYWTG